MNGSVVLSPVRHPDAVRRERRQRVGRLALLAITVIGVLLLSGVVVARQAGLGGVSLVAEDGGSDGRSGGEGGEGGDSGEDQGKEGGKGSNDGDADGGKGDADDQGGKAEGGGAKGGQDPDAEFPGRDQIGRASANEYVDIADVDADGVRGLGGRFSGGSYTVRCALSSHHNSDNYLIAPGKRNGAQHMHDYAGSEATNAESDDDSIGEADTTCTNGDKSPIFWPVLRDLDGVGPDLGADGGSLDGNVGSFVEPSSIDFTFHGHGSRRTEPLPLNIALVTGSAKAATANGEGANAKYTCSGATNRMTEEYPICPRGSALMRIYDFPSCWNGRDLDSEDHASHITYPDEDGECERDEVPVPALRITVAYDDPPPGRAFAIDSFPEQQHDPITDHALLEYVSTQRRADAGADCINAARRCVQGADQDTTGRGSSDRRDQLVRSVTFAGAMATHAKHGLGGQGRRSGHTSAHPATPPGLPPLPVRAPRLALGPVVPLG